MVVHHQTNEEYDVDITDLKSKQERLAFREKDKESQAIATIVGLLIVFGLLVWAIYK